MDLMQTASLNNFDTKITGTTNDYSKTANSSICVVTSGIPRKPGMTREELIGINAGIVKTVSSNLIKYSPETILIIVSNPMDSMTYLVHKTTDLPKNKIIGMGGALDSARFKYRLAEALNAPISDIDGMVIGEYLIRFDVTVFTIPAFIPINSSLVIPGLRGIPEVTTQIDLFAVLL